MFQVPTGIILGNQFEENGSDLSCTFLTNGIIMQNIFGSSTAPKSMQKFECASRAPVVLPEACTGAFLMENAFLYDLRTSLDNLGQGTVLLENKEAKNVVRTMFGPVEVQMTQCLGVETASDADRPAGDTSISPFITLPYLFASLPPCLPKHCSHIPHSSSP